MFTLTIKTDNAAFEDDPGPELYHILLKVAERVKDGQTDGKCIDHNGNTVGQYKLS